MERTWKPTTAGILNIIGGSFGLIAGIVLTALGGKLSSLPWLSWGVPLEDIGDILSISPILEIVGVVIIVLGIIAIVGGIFALQRRIWGLALAGAICVLFISSVGVLGILSVVFVAMGKKEFA